jgi:hypothetical protein
MPSLSVFVILGCNIAMLVLSLVYFRHCRVNRPPIGVFNLSVVLLAVLIITLAHVVYVVLPLWLAVGLFALAVFSAVYFTLEPLVHARPHLARKSGSRCSRHRGGAALRDANRRVLAHQ